MDLVKIRKGIHALGSTEIDNSRPPAVAMHPYYIAHKPAHYSGYLARLEEFLRSYDGPLVTFEEVTKIHSTAERLDRLKRSSFFLETRVMDSEPKHPLNWEEVFEFLRKFGGGTVRLLGGYYSESRFDGCLTALEAQLRDNNFTTEVLGELFFVESRVNFKYYPF